MTRIAPGDSVVYEVALCEHPVLVSEDDPDHEMVSDEDMIREAESMLDADFDFPDFQVLRSDPPDMPLIRYVNTTSRINVKMVYEDSDPFEAVTERVRFDGWDRWPDDVDMSCWSPTHIDDFDGEIHIDLTGGETQ